MQKIGNVSDKIIEREIARSRLDKKMWCGKLKVKNPYKYEKKSGSKKII